MMKIITCTGCGAKSKENIEAVEVAKCKICGEQSVIEIATSLSISKHKGFKNVIPLRKEREKYIQFDIVKQIKKYSEDLLSINSYDYYSNYLLAYATDRLGDSSKILQFYSTPVLATKYDLIQVINHISKHANITHNEEILKFFKTLPLEDMPLYRKKYKNYVSQTNDLSNLEITNKNIFISYNEIDTDKVINILKMVNYTNITYFTSNTNFTEKQRLIEKCDLFVSIASQESMQSKNVIDELTYAMEFNKPMLEVKLDKVERSVLFNQAFSNRKGIDLRVINEKTFNILTSTIVEKLKDVQNEVINLNKEKVKEEVVEKEVETTVEEIKIA